MTPLDDAEQVDIGITYTEWDGECTRCGELYVTSGVVLIWDHDEICMSCAPPEVAQAARAVDQLHDALVLGDLSPANRQGIAATLRNLARLADQIGSGQRIVRKRLDLGAGEWSGGLPVGVHLDWHIDSALR